MSPSHLKLESNADIPKERKEVEEKKKKTEKKEEEEKEGGKILSEINSQHPTGPVLGSLPYSDLSHPPLCCSKAESVFDT